MSFRHHYYEKRSVVTATGQWLFVRDIRTRDAKALMEGFARLTPDEIRMRFLYPMKALTLDLANRLTRLHRHREIALVLTDSRPPGDAPIFAVVRAARQPYSKVAEFAIVVPQALAHQGLGHMMMQELIIRCQQAGVEELVGDMLVDNHPMQALARKLGFAVTHHAQDFGQMRLNLKLT